MKVKDFLKSLVCYISSILFIVSSGLVYPVYAEVHLPTGREDEFAENNIVFYNPNGADTGCRGSYVSASGDQITWIGDSYSAIYQSKIEEMFNGVDIHAESDKWFSGETRSPGGDSGITILQSLVDSNSLRQYLVFALGTNGNVTEEELDKLEEIAGANTRIVIPTLYTQNASYSSSNAAIMSARSKYNNIYVADWESSANGHSEYFNDDGIHPNDEGIGIWLNLIKSALPKTYVTSGGQSGSYINNDDYNSGNYSHWDGSCSSVSKYDSKLKAQLNDIIKAAEANQSPWEALIAQMIMESGWSASEVCPYNPLGLKGSPSCDGSHRTFSNYTEAYSYYFSSIISVKKAAGKFTSSPYSFIEYIQYGVPHGESYAQCSKQSYIDNDEYGCGGHQIGDPTPIYVGSVSSYICGLQKWAEANGYPISSENYSNFESPYKTKDPGQSTGGSTTRGSNGTCSYNGSTEIDEGGLTYEQAKQFVINYGKNTDGWVESVLGDTMWNVIGSLGCKGGEGSNCVSFSKFFMDNFTDTPYPGGNGDQIASNITDQSKVDSTPGVFAIISGKPNHTAVILGYHDGVYVIGQASCASSNHGPGDGTPSGHGSAIAYPTSDDSLQSVLSTAWLDGSYYRFVHPTGIETGNIERFIRDGKL